VPSAVRKVLSITYAAHHSFHIIDLIRSIPANIRDLNDWQGAYQIYNTVKVRTMTCNRTPVTIPTLLLSLLLQLPLSLSLSQSLSLSLLLSRPCYSYCHYPVTATTPFAVTVTIAVTTTALSLSLSQLQSLRAPRN
jgi:hypothetical protein